MPVIDYQFYKSLLKPRPTGSKNNNIIIKQIKEIAEKMGYYTESIPFKCKLWEKSDSYLETDSFKIKINPGPFSPYTESYSDICFINNIKELRDKDIEDKIVILEGEIAKEPVFPKDFLFYYPDEHKEINDLLEMKKPMAVVAATGKHPMCGLEPYPLFEDGNFSIPSAYLSIKDARKLKELESAKIIINSKTLDSESSQLIIRKMPKTERQDTVIICAHIDTAYDTPGALDNASGVAVMFKIMEYLSDKKCKYNFEFIPFNGEDYFEISGQRKYLEKYPINEQSIKLVLNIDDAGHIGSKNALSLYNIDKITENKINNLISGDKQTVIGDKWYESDHTMFVQSGIPTLTFTSSDLLESTIRLTHTSKDNLNEVDYKLITCMSNFAVNLFKQLNYF